LNERHKDENVNTKSVVHAADVAGLPVRGDSAIFEACGKNKVAPVRGAVAFSVNRVGSAMVDVNEECELFLPEGYPQDNNASQCPVPQSQLGWTGLIQPQALTVTYHHLSHITITHARGAGGHGWFLALERE
jgi:hypothetical protein